jgi:pSer/pThr/pTyr-binding forkhead associated (FHA) protein
MPVDVDLTPFGAKDLGVSRRHLRINRLRDSIRITDLGSSNGTFLNRDRLTPFVAYLLRNRAVLRLGKMILRVRFV